MVFDFYSDLLSFHPVIFVFVCIFAVVLAILID